MDISFLNLQKNLNQKAVKTEHNRQICMNNSIYLSSLKALTGDLVSFKGAGKNESYVTSIENLFNNYSKLDKTINDYEATKLAKIAASGIPVKPGFIIASDASKERDNVLTDVENSIKQLENKTSKTFGDPSNPLILSVKKANNIAYVGLNDNIAKELADNTGYETSKRNIYASYCNAISTFGTNVCSINNKKFLDALNTILERHKVININELKSNTLINEVIPAYKQIFIMESRCAYPQDVSEQLKMFINYKINSHKGPIVVQTKTFNNYQENSGVGICNTRNPKTGENKINGDILLNSTGIDLLKLNSRLTNLEDLANIVPEEYTKLLDYAKTIEKIFHRPQCIHFALEEGKIKIISSEKLDLSPAANIKASVDMFKEGSMNKKELITYVKTSDMVSSRSKAFVPNKKQEAIQNGNLITTGTGASHGAAWGKAVFNTERAKQLIQQGEKVILIKNDTNAEDIDAMVKSEGIVASHAGTSSHAAVIARGESKPCIVACHNMNIDTSSNKLTVNNTTINEGDIVSIDGQTGEIFKGKIDTIDNEPSKEFYELLQIIDNVAPIKVYANADTPEDAQTAKSFGAEGVGLCRTEHMFFKPERVPIMQNAILANNPSERQQYLNQLENFQQRDFHKIFNKIRGDHITIRLLDPPLNEFIPKSQDLIAQITKLENQNTVSKTLKKITNTKPEESLEELREKLKKIKEHEEANPMMGMRGSRLGIDIPEFYEMQVRAIIKAALETDTTPQIMLPMISTVKELDQLTTHLKEVAKNLLIEKLGPTHPKVKKMMEEIKFGTMIEIPRAALTAESLAKFADFFSFGTNDLTQFTWGSDRDGKQIATYMKNGILKENPFEKLDKEGVGSLIKTAIDKGKSVKKDLEIGICGEQGGDPSSILFFIKSGVDYVSVSPSRLPTARLAAAKNGIKKLNKTNNVSFGANTKSPGYNALVQVLEEDFEKNIQTIARNANESADYIKASLKKEYGIETANAVNISGDNIGFNNFILIIPGTDRNGRVLDILPIVKDTAEHGKMGGGHWDCELHFIKEQLPKIINNYKDFNFEKLRHELNLISIDNNIYVPAGARISVNSKMFDVINKGIRNSTTIDSHGKPNFASLHGFFIYDNTGNRYIVLDNKYGIKEFVVRNKEKFDEMAQKFNVNAVIVGGESAFEDKRSKEEKEKDDTTNQLLGELSNININVTDLPDNKNLKNITNTDLIKLITNTASNKKYIDSLNN